MDGRLLPFVCLWSARPERMACGRGFIWRRGLGLDGYLESLWPWETTAAYGITATDDLQCIRMGAP